MALKAAGVRHARIGDCEFDFEPEYRDEPKQARAEYVPAATPAAPQMAPVTAVSPRQAGYMAALGPELPRFRPVDE